MSEKRQAILDVKNVDLGYGSLKGVNYNRGGRTRRFDWRKRKRKINDFASRFWNDKAVVRHNSF
jgi:hypothetical protein